LAEKLGLNGDRVAADTLLDHKAADRVPLSVEAADMFLGLR
jgi:hypothetical protein